MNSKELCSICGEGHVTPHVDQIESEYKGKKAMVPLHYKVCDTCTSDFAGADESRLNKRGLLAFRKLVDGLLTGAEIRALRDKYRLTQGQAARLFGGGPVAFSKYENDDVSHSEAMDSLLRLVFASQDAFLTLVLQKGMADELCLQRPSAAQRIFRSEDTNVIYVEAWSEAASPSHHTTLSHIYASYSEALEPRAAVWKQ